MLWLLCCGTPVSGGDAMSRSRFVQIAFVLALAVGLSLSASATCFTSSLIGISPKTAAPNQLVTISEAVKNCSSVTESITVKFVVTEPNGTKVTLATTTFSLSSENLRLGTFTHAIPSNITAGNYVITIECFVSNVLTSSNSVILRIT